MNRFITWRSLTAVFLLLFVATAAYTYTQLDLNYYVTYQQTTQRAANVSTIVYQRGEEQLVTELQPRLPWQANMLIAPGKTVLISATSRLGNGELVLNMRAAYKENGRFATNQPCHNHQPCLSTASAGVNP